ncbi:MAG: NAD-binding protein, partial [Lachnospiraceae bacterium]|nr:NAD-binding protein [Lachnospiraceae bacterium]
MKSILIIGLGRFGQHLCRQMVERKNEVMVIDVKEDNV